MTALFLKAKYRHKGFSKDTLLLHLNFTLSMFYNKKGVKGLPWWCSG